MTHGSLLYRLNWEWDRFPLNENDVLCQKSPSVFSDFFFETFGAMLAGVPFLLLGHGASRDVERLMNKMEQYGVTKVVMVASLLKAMHRLSNGLVGRLPKLRYIRTSGEPMEISLAEATVKAIPGVSIVNMFGSTEMLNPVSFHFTAASEGEFEPAAYVPAGLPLPGRITALLDENLLPVPWGECGMIYTAGPGLTPGYISGGTEQVFYQLSLTGEELRFFKSGDLGRLDDKGRLHYLGRKDHQIKIRGVRIESQEVQDAMNAFGDVQESVVVPWKDPDGNVRLVGFVIRQPDGNQKKDNDIFVQTLRAHLLECLPAVMVPELIRVLAEWPRTPSGKISRLLLLEQLNAQRVQPCVKRRGDSMEDALANLWRQVLGAEAGENLNFFEAGGNSLVLVSLHEKMQRKFSVRFPLTELFQNPTIESQARLLFRLAQHGLAKENGPERSLPSRDSRQASLGARRKAAAG
jgi:acyl-coenzyme A synthetase/AMP-(fatty) acid ligase